MYILRVKRSQELYAIRFIHEALEWHYCERKFKSFTNGHRYLNSLIMSMYIE